MELIILVPRSKVVMYHCSMVFGHWQIFCVLA